MVTDWYQCVADYAAANSADLGVHPSMTVRGVQSLVFHVYQDHSVAEFDIVADDNFGLHGIHCQVNLFEIRDFLKQRAATA